MVLLSLHFGKFAFLDTSICCIVKCKIFLHFNCDIKSNCNFFILIEFYLSLSLSLKWLTVRQRYKRTDRQTDSPLISEQHKYINIFTPPGYRCKFVMLHLPLHMPAPAPALPCPCPCLRLCPTVQTNLNTFRILCDGSFRQHLNCSLFVERF